MKKKILLSLFTVIFAVTFALGLSGFDKTEKADAATSLTISAAGKAHDMASGAVDSTDNTKANFSGNKTNYGKDQGNHYGWVKIAGDTTNGVEIINFTVTQTGGSDDLNLVIGVLSNSSEDWPYNNNTFYGLDASNSTGSAYSLESKKLVTLPTISSGNSNNTLNVTLTLSANNKDAYLYLYFCPHITSSFNNSSFSVSNIFFGAAETEPEFTMVGAQMRFDDPTGIRFAAELENVQEGYSYGMLILPKNIAEHCVNVNTFNSNLDYIAVIDEEAEEYFAYLRNKGQSAQYYMSSKPQYDETAGKFYVYGSIASVLYNNTNRDFFALAFKENESGRKYASFTSGGKSIGNLGDIVKELYDDDDLEDKEIEILDYYLLRSEYQAAGVSAANYSSDATGSNISISMDSALTVYVGSTETLEPSVSINTTAVSTPVLTYSSSDTDVATVSDSGVISGVSTGYATITVSYLNGKKTATCAVTVDEITLYGVTVTNGSTNKDSAPEGATVTITADSPAEGKRFNGWTVSAGGVTLADSTASTTTFPMGTADVTVVANYIDVYTVTVTNGTTDKATAAAGETVTITANDPATGYAFNGWTVTAGNVTLDDDDETKTTFTMGTANVSVKAEYKDVAVVNTANITSIEAFTNNSNWSNSVITDNNKTATFTSNGERYGGGGQGAHWALVTVDGASGKNMITFTLSATSAGTVQVGVPTAINMYNTYNNNNLAVLDGVTYNGAAATKVSDKNLYNIPLGTNEVTVVMTLSSAISSTTVDIAIYPWNVANWGGTLTVKDFTFTEPTSYDITMSSAASDLASVSTSSATAGTTVTLSAKESGKAVTGFSYESTAGNGNVTGNSFTMPAADVTITSVTVAVKSGETISACMTDGNFSANLSDSDKQVNVSSNHDGADSNNGVYFKVETSKTGIRSVTFKITNTSSSNIGIKLGVCAQDEYGKYKGKFEPSSATVGGSSYADNSDGSYGAKLKSIAQNDSIVLTLTFNTNINEKNGNNNGYVCIKVAPYQSCKGATFSISEFTFN